MCADVAGREVGMTLSRMTFDSWQGGVKGEYGKKKGYEGVRRVWL